MELQNINKVLIKSTEEQRKILVKIGELGQKYAEAERDYQIAKTKAIVILKDEGYPVSLIDSMVRGLDEVSELRFQRDLSREEYKVSFKALSALSTNISAYQSILRYCEEV